MHVGRDLALGIADLIHFVTAVHAAIDVDVFFCRGFGIALQKITRAVIRAPKGNVALIADLPVAVPVGLPDTLFLVTARLTGTILAKVIGVLACSMLAVLGTVLAQAAGCAKFLLAGALAAGRAGVGVPLAGVIRADVVLFAVLPAVLAQLAGLAQLIGIEALSTVRAHMLVFVVGVLFAAVVLAVEAVGTGRAAPAELAGVVAGALFAFGAKVVLVVAALDAQIVVAALGLGVFAAAFLAQAAVVAHLKTRALPAVLALLATGQLGAARAVRSVTAFAAPALNAVVIVKVDVLVAFAAVVTVAHAAGFADAAAGFIASLFAKQLVRGASSALEAVLVVVQGALLAEFTVPAVIALVLEKAAVALFADDRFAGAVRRFLA